MQPIRIAVGDVELDGELNDTEEARRLVAVLPLSSGFCVWGDELHFDVPLEPVPGERTATAVQLGDMALWPEGSTLCLFFGPTPLSPAEDPIAAEPVAIVGRLQDAARLRDAKGADQIIASVARGGEPGDG